MALIKCRECSRDISDQAASCPGCGAPVVVQENTVRAPERVSLSGEHFIATRDMMASLAKSAVLACNYKLDEADEASGTVSFTTGMTMGSWSGVSGTIIYREISPYLFDVNGAAKQNVRGGQMVALNLFGEAKAKVDNVIDAMRRQASTLSGETGNFTAEPGGAEAIGEVSLAGDENKTLLIVVAVLLLLMGLAYLATSSSAPSNAAQSSYSDAANEASAAAAEASDAAADAAAAAAAAAAAENPTPASGGWTYSSDDDKVRGGTTFFASTTSTNSVYQAPPYDSSTTMKIMLRESPAGGTDVMLIVSSGQLMCPSYEGCSGTVRFDNGLAQRISFNGPEDNSSDTIFVEGAESFIAKLKKAKRVVIEKTLYEAGNPQFEFDVSGLKWSH